MTIEIDKIFSATAQSPWQFVSFGGQGCYIPAYQRQYSWDSDNVDRRSRPNRVRAPIMA